LNHGTRSVEGGVWMLTLCFALGFGLQGARSATPFSKGREAYATGNFQSAAELFREAATNQLASGTLQNLGNSEWQAGRSGFAILAWEQTLWIDPFNRAAQGNLTYARKAAQLEAPELTWYEVVSTWLPANWWAWLIMLSFWIAAAAAVLPAIFRWRKTGWQQATVALCLTLFLLSVPAQIGVITRANLGVILPRDTSLRLTPTTQAQVLSRLPAGQPGRWIRRRGENILVRTARGLGWVRRDEFGLICQ
jgi:tetratricopeptide (TPR) repeat protein